MSDDARGDDAADLELLQGLRAATAALDPVPPAVLAAARGSLAWRGVGTEDLDAQLAELLSDSLEALSGARAAVLDARLLTFGAGGLTVELEVSGSGGQRQLAGQLVPPGPAEVRVRAGGEVVRVDADEHGWFSCPLPPGPLSLVVRRPGERPVVTSWTAV